jgi:hypothetical protein
VTDDMIGTFDWTPKCAATARCAISLPKRSKADVPSGAFPVRAEMYSFAPAPAAQRT